MTIIKFIFIGLAAIMFLALVKKVFSMSSPVGKNEPFVIMSPFKATITRGGKPVANAQVKLNYSWNSGNAEEQEGFDEFFTTDTNGILSMPEIKRDIFVSRVQTTASNYSIEIKNGDEWDVIHSIGKKDPALNGELNVELDMLSCELTDPLMIVVDMRRHVGSLYTTRCRADQFKEFRTEEI